MKLLARLSTIAFLFALAAPMAHANEFMFSEASLIVVGPACILWFLIGLALILNGRKIRFIGLGAAIVFILSGVPLGHPEIALCFWMFYLALVTIRVALQKKHDTDRSVNLIYHSSFLALVIGGGAIAKAIYWSNNGGFAAWAEWMREIFPFFLYFFGVIALFVIGWTIIRGWIGRKAQG